jgi:O-antigen/teichoic acid export membrane protein
LRIAFIGVGSILLFSFTTHSLQALQKFVSWSAIQVGTNLVRLLIIVIFYYMGSISVANTLGAYIIMPFLGFVFGLFILPSSFIKVTNENKVSKDFFNYNKWVAAFTLVAAIGSRLDTFITARLLSAAQLGIYAAANQLVQIVPQIVVAIGTVIAPKMASMTKIDDLVAYIKKTQVMVIVLSFMGVLAIPFVIYLIPILFGSEYLGSIPVFVVLLFGMLIFLISVPVHNAIFYYFSYPKLFLWLSLVHISIISVGGWFAISTYGVIGAAVVVLLGQVVGFVVPTIWIVRKIRLQRLKTST